jgi:choline dehydrogenase
MSLPALIYWLFSGKGPASSNVSQGSFYLLANAAHSNPFRQVGESVAFVRSLDPTLPYHSDAVANLPDIVDTTSGPNAPDLEIISAPISFLNHGLTQPPSGSHCFSLVSVCNVSQK